MFKQCVISNIWKKKMTAVEMLKVKLLNTELPNLRFLLSVVGSNAIL